MDYRMPKLSILKHYPEYVYDGVLNEIKTGTLPDADCTM